MSELYFDEPEYPFFENLKKCVRLYINLSLAIFIAFIALRAFELIFISLSKQLPEDFDQVVFTALLYDLLFWLKLLSVFILPFIIIYFNTRFKRTSQIWFCVYGTVLIIAHFLLIKFYAIALVPLGADLFGYSLSEIKQTVGTVAKIDLLSIAAFVVAIALFWLIANIFFKHQILQAPVSFVLLFIGSAFSYFNFSAIPSQATFKTDFAYNLAINKQAYFFAKSSGYFFKEDSEPQPTEIRYLDDNKTSGTGELKYGDTSYPFLRNEETPDVLGDFFTID